MSIEAMKQALEALEILARYENPETRIQVRKPKDGGPIVTMYPHKVALDAAQSLRQAIEQAEKQEPVAWRETHGKVIRALAEIVTVHTPDNLFDLDAVPRDPVMGLVQKIKMAIDVYKPPTPQREWVGLTQEDIDIAFDDTQEGGGFNEFARAIEQTLRRKNT
jgi:hypothetical protein